MSRFKRVIHGAASSYGLLATTALYSLASVPLALHFLTKEQFALWALISAIGNYLGLIDLGMSGSLFRLLIDYKDQRNEGTYGSLIRTGVLVLMTQGAIVFAIGFSFAPLFCDLLKIEPSLQNAFISLVRWQSGLLAFGFAIRIFSHLLYAHQRIDVSNYVQIGVSILNFFTLWFFFRQQQSVFSLIWTNLLGTLATATILFIACWRLGLFPSINGWGRISWQRFREIFDYGKDIFLVAVGTQLIMASQTIIITRTLGLEMAAIWSVGTKVFNLVSQAIWRISDVSAPAFSEMIVRNEREILRNRYRSMVMLTASLSGFAAVSYALCNSLFVTIWTNGKISWPPINDVLLACWIIVMALIHCHSGFVLLTKQIRFMRYIYFVEGVVFVTSAFITSRWGGLPAIIGCSIVCSAVFSGAYGVSRMSNYFNCPFKEVGLDWLKPMGKVLACYIPAALLVWWGGAYLNGTSRLVLNILICSCLGLFFFLRHGLSRSFQTELLHRAPQRINPFLKRILIGVQ